MAVPLRARSALLKSVTASLKTTWKFTGVLLAGSAWPAAWLIVTLGATMSITVVVAVALLLVGSESLLADATVAVFERTVPAETSALTETARVKTALPTGIDGELHETVPLAPTAGVVQLQPPGADRDTNAVPAGKVSDQLAASAGSGPALFTVIV